LQVTFDCRAKLKKSPKLPDSRRSKTVFSHEAQPAFILLYFDRAVLNNSARFVCLQGLGFEKKLTPKLENPELSDSKSTNVAGCHLRHPSDSELHFKI